MWPLAPGTWSAHARIFSLGRQPLFRVEGRSFVCLFLTQTLRGPIAACPKKKLRASAFFVAGQGPNQKTREYGLGETTVTCQVIRLD